MPTRRLRPLTASDGPMVPTTGDAAAVALPDGTVTGAQPDAVSERERRFVEGLRTLRVGTVNLLAGERVLLVLGGVLAPTGLAIILIGWYGAARTALLFEQVPYLISGGLFGLGLVVLGSFLYFAHWMTQLVREHRAQSAAVVAALEAVEQRLVQLGEPSSPVREVPAPGPAGLVATAHGTMAHLPHCAVVAGKSDLRPVGHGDGMERCRLCAPE